MRADILDVVMRKLLLIGLLALVVPATALPRNPPPPPPTANGTLSIREGRGTVQLNARGSITGRLNGKITITDFNPYDAKRPVVYGSKTTVYRGDKVTVYRGSNVRFRAVGPRFKVKLEGRAIFLSAIGRGEGLVDGSGDVQANIFYDGVWSLNDDPYRSLPDDPTAFELAASPPTG
jgi:hypothetical protein